MNLQIAATRLSAVARKEAAGEGGSGLSVAIAVITAADAMMKDDIAANKASHINHSGIVHPLCRSLHLTNFAFRPPSTHAQSQELR